MSFPHRVLIGYVYVISIFCISASFSAPTCPDNKITIQGPLTGDVQCQDCLKCPAGHGLSVKCGDVISPQTPIVCKPCEVGKTFSPGNEAGACKSCENCEEYRETIKACNLTSKAVCGKCKLGAYSEDMTGECEPCSPCCNDGDDIYEPECQVPGVSKNSQCSVLRAEKCSKVVANANVNTRVFVVHENHSATPLPTPTTIKVSTLVSMRPAQGLASTSANDSISSGGLIGVAVGVSLVLFLVLLAGIFCFWKIKREQGENANQKDDVESKEELGKQQNGGSGGSSVVAVGLNSEKLPFPVLESDRTSRGVEDTQPAEDYNKNTGRRAYDIPQEPEMRP